MSTFEHSQSIQSKIIPPEKYDGSSHPKPYNFRIEGKGKVLQYFGSGYPTDLADPMFAMIDTVLEELRPQIILIGNAKPVPADALEEHNQQVLQQDLASLVKRGADIAYLKRRAIELGITWVPLEPTDDEEIAYFESQGFSKADIFVFEVIKNLINYQQRGNFADFEKYKTGLLQAIANRTGWKDFDFSEANLVAQIKRIYGRYFTLEDLINDPQLKTLGFPNNTPYFMDKPSAVNEIRNLSWSYRDKHAVEIIAREVENHDRILVLYGSSHAVVQEPALRALLN